MATRGEVYWITYPEPVGRHPALIIQNNAGNQYSPSTIVAYMSTSRPEREYRFVVELDARAIGERSYVHCENINTIPQTMLEEKCGALTPKEMTQVEEALRISWLSGSDQGATCTKDRAAATLSFPFRRIPPGRPRRKSSARLAPIAIDPRDGRNTP